MSIPSPWAMASKSYTEDSFAWSKEGTDSFKREQYIESYILGFAFFIALFSPLVS